jgi:hypothetical protein
MSDDHACPIPGCTTPVPHHQLMCRTHYRMVPAHLGQELYRAYNRGAGQGSERHVRAMEACIEAVEARL